MNITAPNSQTQTIRMQIETQIKSYVAQNLLFTEDFPHDDHASFLGEGILDSVGVMELVAFVESSFQVHVEPTEVTPANFDSVVKLADFVRSKLAVPKP